MMSLLDDFAHECVLLEKTRVRDPEGGWTTAWTDGEHFTVYKYKSTGTEMKIAEQLGVTSVYDGLVDIDFPLSYDDYFRDVETGVTFRVTSDPNEEKAPQSASDGLQKKHFTAEKKVPPG